MPYWSTRTKKGTYKLHYKKNGKTHTIPGESASQEKIKARIRAINASKHTYEIFDQIVNNLLKILL